MTTPVILCDTCGGPAQGGVRRYFSPDDTLRIGCDDDKACLAVFKTRTPAERRLIAACQRAGNYLTRAEPVQ